MQFTEVFLTSEVDPSSVANSRLASPDLPNLQNANVHAHIHSSTAQDIPSQLQNTLQRPFDSCSNTVGSPQQTCPRTCTERDDFKENGNLGHYCMNTSMELLV